MNKKTVCMGLRTGSDSKCFNMFHIAQTQKCHCCHITEINPI